MAAAAAAVMGRFEAAVVAMELVRVAAVVVVEVTPRFVVGMRLVLEQGGRAAWWRYSRAGVVLGALGLCAGKPRLGDGHHR